MNLIPLTINLNLTETNIKGFVEHMYSSIYNISDCSYSFNIQKNNVTLSVTNTNDSIMVLNQSFYEYVRPKIIGDMELHPGDRLTFSIDIQSLYNAYSEQYPGDIQFGSNPNNIVNENDKDEFINMLEQFIDKPLSGDDLNNFKKSFKLAAIKTYGPQSGDRVDRNYGETKMRNIFKKYGLPYEINIKNRIFTLKKINDVV